MDVERGPEQEGKLFERLKKIQGKKAEIEDDMKRYVNMIEKMKETAKRTVVVDPRTLMKSSQQEDGVKPETGRNYVREYEEFKQRRAEREKAPGTVLRKPKRDGIEKQPRRVWGRMFLYNVKTRAVKESVDSPWPGEVERPREDHVDYSELLAELSELQRTLEILQHNRR